MLQIRAIGATMCPDIRQLAVSFDVCPTVFYLALVQSFLVIPRSSFCCIFISVALKYVGCDLNSYLSVCLVSQKRTFELA